MSTLVKNDRKTIFAWAMYDWANSAYATTSGAIVAPFFTSVMVAEGGASVFGARLSGTTLWSAVVSIGAMVLFLAMPVLGAVADFSASKRSFLRTFAFLGAGATVLLFTVPDGWWVLFLIIFLISQIGFVAGNVFYDGFLPQIASDDTVDRVSSKGFAFGYIGGGLYLLAGLMFILFSGDDSASAPRLVMAGAGVWWFVFTLWVIRQLPEVGEAEEIPPEYAHRPKLTAFAAIGFKRTLATARKLRGFPHILLFVLAYMFYNDGTQTVINVSGAYAEDTLGLTITDVAITFLVVQFVAFGGALAFGVLAERIGTKRAILFNLAVWSGLAVAGYFLPEGEAIPLYVLGAFVGLVLGGVQALSRSLYSTMIPEVAAAEFFGFFSVFSKFSAIWGPFLFALISGFTGSGRPAIAALVVFFVVGGALLSRVNVEAAQASREQWNFEGTEVT